MYHNLYHKHLYTKLYFTIMAYKIDEDWAAKRYEEGIERIGGAETYVKCGEEKSKGFLAVAECLHEAKSTALSTKTMVDRYKAAARS